MNAPLVIEDGPAILLTGRPDQGTTHEVLYGSLVGSGNRVVLKLERTPGALEREAAALRALGPDVGFAPRLISASFIQINGQRTRCLVIERCPGSPPTTVGGWRRMGRAFARLALVPPPPTGLPILDARDFGANHVQRVRELGSQLDPFTETIPDWPRLASAELPVRTPLVITHGDPGAGNYLDDGSDGFIIDWELAHIAPRGLDLARLRFIALLGAGPTGYVARDHQARADAALSGYFEATSDFGVLSQEEARWWKAVAAIQFVHRRWQLGGYPAPWQEAAKILLTSLS